MSKRDEYLTYLKGMKEAFDMSSLKKIFEGESEGVKIKQPRLLNELFNGLGLSNYNLSESFSRAVNYFGLDVNKDDRPSVNDTELSTVLHTLLHLKAYQGQLLLFTDKGWGTVDDKTLNNLINAVSVIILNTNLQTGSKLKQIREYLQDNAPGAEDMIVRSHIQLHNGCFNTKTGEFEGHDADVIPLIRLNVDLKDSKPMETNAPKVFKRFIMESVENDKGYYEYLTDVYASLIDSNAPTLITGAILHGPGGNGKTVLMDLLENMFNPSNVAVKTLDDMGGNFGLENLNHSMINISHELSSLKPKAESVRQLKRLLDKDPGPSEVNEKYKKAVNRLIDIKMIFASNSVVDFGKEQKEPLSRRLTVLPFNFRPAKKDYSLKDKLVNEKEDILAYLLRRITEIHQRGRLSRVPTVVEHSEQVWFSTDTYIDSDSQLTQEVLTWLNQNVEKTEGSKVNKVEVSDDLKNEIPKVTAQKCNKIIKNILGFQEIKDTHGRYWKDMRYKSSNEAANDNPEPDMFLEEYY